MIDLAAVLYQKLNHFDWGLMIAAPQKRCSSVLICVVYEEATV